MLETPKTDLRILFDELGHESQQYFAQAARELGPSGGDTTWQAHQEPNLYWGRLEAETRQVARTLVDNALRYAAQLSNAARSAPLAGAEDLVDVREATKSIRAALRLRRYQYHDIEILNDEDQVLGVRQPSQSESEELHPTDAQIVFSESMVRLYQVLTLVEASADLRPSLSSSESEQAPARYRPDTAFIMMWMDPQKPDLADLADAVKEVFRTFNVLALRADDIEHEGQITERVLSELRTSEFLFADLTGARPNVYYEVGFAHALGRRVILYRREGTGLHFDLAGYNCPEYESLRDLKQKLSRRLEIVTNRKPRTSD
jgi:hypothetical protein